MSYFRIRNIDTREVIEGTPSPLLIQVGGGEAYEAWEGFWRLRDDTHDIKGTTYTKVRIEHLDDYRVDVTIKPIGPGPEETAEYEDYFIVQAESEQEAFRLGEQAAREDVENRYGDEYGSIVTVIRARKGVSI